MLQKFMSKNQNLSEEMRCNNKDGEVEIELDLSLSLNGRFGVDPLAKTRLRRSSSVLDVVVNDRSGLNRTCSLPVETEEDWRKRKELQSLRRLEAKRRKSEKQRKHKAGGEEKVLEERSFGSSGSGSSGLSELETIPPPVQATTNKSMEASPPTAQSQPENPSKEAGRNIMEDMPGVSTIGHGPNGRKVNGFLCRYKKGKEVQIVCVCHGNFFSPAEFVKHAGGGDVTHPLKHIVVNPSPFL
ncbi:Ninja-family protein AFP3 [Cardamine amara subsp. amara]|uniref:Ninja-family protein n=1 Tax=Cardamine amara subsp. amara TaxID=228776 RepID=A0ABD0ZIH5_CARAN